MNSRPPQHTLCPQHTHCGCDCCPRLPCWPISNGEQRSSIAARSRLAQKMQPQPQHRSKFKAIAALRMLEEPFTNHESIPPFDSAYRSFTDLYPDYTDTSLVDCVREDEYGSLEMNDHVCFDYSGYGLFSDLQQELDLASCSFGLAYQSANLPAQALYGGAGEGTAEFDIKRRILKFFRIEESEYCMVFTASRGSAFKLLAESYPFHLNKRLLTVYDHESQGVTWMEEVARRKGATVTNAHFGWPTLRLCSSDLKAQLLEKRKKKKKKKKEEEETAKGMFAFPLQSRVSGAKYAYQWMARAQQNDWHVLFDASSVGPKVMDSLGLSLFHPDFIISSFYKVYGSDPTGFGCLFIKRSAVQYLHTSSAARGVGMVKIVPRKTSLPKALHDASGLEKQEIHAIKGKDEQGVRGIYRAEAGLICMPSFSGLLTSHKHIETRTQADTLLSILKKKANSEHELGKNGDGALNHDAHSGVAVDDENRNFIFSYKANEVCNDHSQGSDAYLASLKCDTPQNCRHAETQSDEMSGCYMATDGATIEFRIHELESFERMGLSESINHVAQTLEKDIDRRLFKGSFGIIAASSSCEDCKVESTLKKGDSEGFDHENEPSSSRPLERKYKFDSAFCHIKDQTGDARSSLGAGKESEMVSMPETLEEQQTETGPYALDYLSREKKIEVANDRLTTLQKSKRESINTDPEGPEKVDALFECCMLGERLASDEMEDSSVVYHQETTRCDADQESSIERPIVLVLPHKQGSAVEKIYSSQEGISHTHELDGQSGTLRNSVDAGTTIHGSSKSNEIDVVDDLFTDRMEPEIICRGLDHVDSLSLFKMNNRHRYLVNWFVASMLKLRHPGPDNAVNLTQIYGPKVKYDRGPSVAFNIFDWKGVLLQPNLVQRLADRSNISLGIGTLHHIQFPESHTDGDHAITTVEETNTAGEKSMTIKVLTASLGFFTNFKDVYRLWAFVSKFLDADFVAKEAWRYRSLNQGTVVVGI